MLKIETPRLLIRNFSAADAASLREIILQKESSAFAAYDYQWPTSEAEIIKITEWFASEDQYLAVCLKENRKFIGFIVLNQGSESVYELGYSFNSDYHGKGYATEGCKALIDFVFSKLRATKITAGTAAVNEPSLRLLDRLGLRKVGEMTVSFRKTEEGKPIEFLGYEYALLREEWEKGNLVQKM